MNSQPRSSSHSTLCNTVSKTERMCESDYIFHGESHIYQQNYVFHCVIQHGKLHVPLGYYVLNTVLPLYHQPYTYNSKVDYEISLIKC